MKKHVGSSFLTLGLIFVAIGFVIQGMTLSFDSGLFNLGIIFVLGGAVSKWLEKRQHAGPGTN